MSADFVMVHCSWDSGPYGTYYKCSDTKPEIDAPGGYGRNTVPIPVDVWERYERAQQELNEAEDELGRAEQAFLDEARPLDPRWQEYLARPEGAS